jgi:NAD(P) transhydrogenase subunit beta
MDNFTAFIYLVAAVCFIMALRGLSHPESAQKGVIYGMAGMALAVGVTFIAVGAAHLWILLAIVLGGGIGTVVATKIEMTALPELVAMFNALVGLAAVMVAGAAFYNPAAFGIGLPGNIAASNLLEMSLSVAIGAVTFSGSLVAWAKLGGKMSGKPIMFSGQHKVNLGLASGLLLLIGALCLSSAGFFFWALALTALAFGVLIIIPVGGADMPVIVSMLNSYSGWASVGVGFTLDSTMMIVTGSLVGASGAILSYIMCKGMNRSFSNVLLGGFGGEQPQAASGADDGEAKNARLGAAEDAAYIMKNASKVIIVPGYGMAVAQAQHAVREMADTLKSEGIDVRYAIHPVAGRMPGHMNVLLAEANVPYDDVFEQDDINRDFAQTDVVYVIGANDITNPAAKTDSSSPIYGMPVLDVENAATVLFVKRSLGSGYAGIDNPLFYRDNTMMLLGDAKKMTEQIIKALD